MSSAPTGTLLSSVKKQFELLAEQSERDLVLILFEPGPGVSLKDALLMCPFSRDHCPDGSPDAQSIVRLRWIDERTIQEFIFASPYAGKTRGEFLKRAREAGNCLGDWTNECGVSDAVLAEKGPAVRWMKLLFSFALDRPDFPARAKWYCLNLPDQSSGRYAVISDAVRCSLYAIDGLMESASLKLPRSHPASSEAGIEADRISRLCDLLLEENGQEILAHFQNSKLSSHKRMCRICDLDVRFWQRYSPFWAKAFDVSEQAIRQTKFWRKDRPQFLKRVQELSDDRYPER
jgi:hypothetical protein